MITAGQRYRHFKGITVKVLMLAKHSETLEELVIYIHEDTNEVWARPKALFQSTVDHNKYPDITQKYRFELIEE